MDGTRPDGNVTVAADEALVVDAELGHCSTTTWPASVKSHWPPSAARSNWNSIAAWAGAAREAKRLLGAYLAYKQALAGIEKV